MPDCFLHTCLCLLSIKAEGSEGGVPCAAPQDYTPHTAPKAFSTQEHVTPELTVREGTSETHGTWNTGLEASLSCCPQSTVFP